MKGTTPSLLIPHFLSTHIKQKTKQKQGRTGESVTSHSHSWYKYSGRGHCLLLCYVEFNGVETFQQSLPMIENMYTNAALVNVTLSSHHYTSIDKQIYEKYKYRQIIATVIKLIATMTMTKRKTGSEQRAWLVLGSHIRSTSRT